MITPIFQNKCELKDLGLVKDGDTNEYYLTATYRVEDEREIREVTIPKIKLPVVQDSLMVDIDTKSRRILPDVSVAMGFGQLDVEYDKNGRWYHEIIIKEKVHEMTLEEIEKKLGYKVKVVSEKKEVRIKGRDCDKCKFSYGNDCAFALCNKCPNRTSGKCNCGRVKSGDVCPYFKEA